MQIWAVGTTGACPTRRFFGCCQEGKRKKKRQLTATLVPQTLSSTTPLVSATVAMTSLSCCCSHAWAPSLKLTLKKHVKVLKNPPTALTASVSCLYTPTQCQLELCNPLRLYLVFNINKCQGRQRVARISSSLNPQGAMDFSMEEEEVGPDVTAAPPPTPGRIDILVTKDVITRLDLTPAHEVFRKYVYQIGDNTSEPPDDPEELFKRTVGFVLDYERDDPLDPRELSEYPDIRLWFVRLDAAYPWLPIVLDWRAGELSRYVAMLVPHQMSRRLGLVFNPEALELFAMNKLFLLHTWLNARKVPKPAVRINDMMRILGFGISEQLYSLLEESPHP